LRRIRALREMELTYIREMQRMESGGGDNDDTDDGLLGSNPFERSLRASLLLDREGLPLQLVGNSMFGNRLRLMLLNRYIYNTYIRIYIYLYIYKCTWCRNRIV
jgi:hypothetical protein